MEEQVEGLMQSLTAGHPLRSLEIFEFGCTVTCPDNYIGPLIQSAVSAYRIRISTGHIYPISSRLKEKKRRLMPRLQFLSLSSFEFYNRISAPNLRELTLDSLDNKDIILLDRDDMVDLQKLTIKASDMDRVCIYSQSFLNCKSITFIYFGCPQYITPLTRLECVEFPHHGDAEAVNKFLLKMLANPEACPRLHTIAMSEFPLWELLFEVLRKRNSSGVQRITHIRLPRLPVLQLLWRLVRLLSGEKSVFTDRDVDEVIAKRIACPQM
jgi:hypothetical protein